ncbi:MAG: oxygenase MpaB family protein [Cyanobacteria bacterium P01_A01_bin.116]
MVHRNRYSTAQRIEQLDPDRDAIAICHLLAGYEFPWDITRALEIALLRTFCTPAVSTLLDKTGEFHRHTQKRYDDTGLIVSELFKWGYEHPRGQVFLDRMNAIHQRYPIENSDYLYVLSTFVYEPVRWCGRFGWRAFSDREKQAVYVFWREVGKRMGITDIPASYRAFEAYNRAYEQTYFAYTEANQRVANSTRQLLLSWLPPVARWPGFSFIASEVDKAIPALLDPPMLQALGWQRAPAGRASTIERFLQVRSRLLRRLPPRTLPDFFVDQAVRSYPAGYSVADIGPPSMLPVLNAQGTNADKQS